MQLAVVVVLVVAVAVLTQQQETSSEDTKNTIRLYREQCIADTQVDPQLIDRADKGDFVDDPKLKCFSKCFYQKTGFVGEDGELLLDAIRSKIPKEENQDRALVVLDKCKELKGEDSCETVYLVHKCYFLEMSASDGDKKQ